MEKMAGHPRLYRRGATYYHRGWVPLDIKETYGKTEETFSLRTSDYQEALKRVRVAAADVDRRFEAHRLSLTLAVGEALDELSAVQIAQVGDVYFSALLAEDEETREIGFFDADAPQSPSPIPDFDEHVETMDVLDEYDRWNHARGRQDEFFLSEAEEVLTWDNVRLRLKKGSPSWQKIAKELRAASIKARTLIRERNQGDIVETPTVPDMSTQRSVEKLSAIVDEWIEEKARTSWVPKTAREHRVWLNNFLVINGDRGIGEYGKADGRRLKAVLRRLPPNWVKIHALKGLSIEEAADRSHVMNLAPMSDRNLNKILDFVSSFWNWAEVNYDSAPTNPMKGLKLKLRGRPQDERDPFSTAELAIIFNSPIYVGCKSVRRWKSPGDVVPRDKGDFWLPLLALYTGARMGELIQLQLSDVKDHGDVAYLDIKDDGADKHLKTLNSRRCIPIHPELVKLGFMEHVQHQRDQGETRLFPEMKKGADGYYSSPYSKKFGRFLESVKVKSRTNAFHSFRHSFEDAARDSDISKELRDALIGHAEEGMSGRYGKGHYIEKLNEAMRVVQYRGLDLSHLYV